MKKKLLAAFLAVAMLISIGITNNVSAEEAGEKPEDLFIDTFTDVEFLSDDDIPDYLKTIDGLAQIPAPMYDSNVRGYIDKVNDDVIEGWTADMTDYDKKLSVQILVYNREGNLCSGVNVTGLADEYRQDLIGTFPRAQSEHCFRIKTSALPWVTLSSGYYQVRAFAISGSERNLLYKSTLPGEPTQDYISFYNSDMFYVRNANSGMYLDVSNGSTANGAKVQQWFFNNGNNQKWVVTHDDNGTYAIEPSYVTEMSLDIKDAVTEDGGIAQLFQKHTNTAQMFKLTPNNNGSFKIRTGCSSYNKCLSVENASCELTANIFQWGVNSSSGNSNEDWFFEKKPSFGAAWEYVSTSNSPPHCFGYAFKVDFVPDFQLVYDPTDKTVYTEEGLANIIETAINKVPSSVLGTVNGRYIKGFTVNPIYNACTPIADDEWRICFRYSNGNWVDGNNQNVLTPNFHFWVQTDTGRWAEKNASDPSRLIGYVFPSLEPWGLGDNPDFYNAGAPFLNPSRGKTYYFSVKRNLGSIAIQ